MEPPGKTCVASSTLVPLTWSSRLQHSHFASKHSSPNWWSHPLQLQTSSDLLLDIVVFISIINSHYSINKLNYWVWYWKIFFSWVNWLSLFYNYNKHTSLAPCYYYYPYYYYCYSYYLTIWLQIIIHIFHHLNWL